MADYTVVQPTDTDHAENLNAMLGHPALADYVLYGLEVQNLNAANGEFDLTEGKVYIERPTAQAIVDDQGTQETRHRVLLASHFDAKTDVGIADADARNYVWARANAGTQDSPKIDVNATGVAPSDDSVLIAVLDADDTDSDGTAESLTLADQPNQGPDIESETIVPSRGTTGVAGGLATGARELPKNAIRGEAARAPVDDAATQGDASILTLLSSGDLPAAYVERVLDGNGGAYGHALNAPLGPYARKNEQVGWDYDSLADVPHWSPSDGGTAAWTQSVTGNPRSIRVETDDAAADTGGVLSTVITSYAALGGFQMVFENVVSNYANSDHSMYVGMTDQDSLGSDITETGNGVFGGHEGGPGTEAVKKVDAGASNLTDTSEFDAANWQNGVDVVVRYDASDGEAGVEMYADDGTTFISLANAAGVPSDTTFSPVVFLNTDGAADSDHVEVERLTIEPLAEVLH